MKKRQSTLSSFFSQARSTQPPANVSRSAASQHKKKSPPVAPPTAPSSSSPGRSSSSRKRLRRKQVVDSSSSEGDGGDESSHVSAQDGDDDSAWCVDVSEDEDDDDIEVNPETLQGDDSSSGDDGNHRTLKRPRSNETPNEEDAADRMARLAQRTGVPFAASMASRVAPKRHFGPVSATRKARVSKAVAASYSSPAASGASPVADDGARMAGPPGAGGPLVRRPGVRYTPLLRQVLDVHEAHPDVVLAVEVGYKYHFYGEHARLASKVGNIMCIAQDPFWRASVPVQRIGIHVERLVRMGHKVGLVRQTETAALKSIGSNKSGPFERKLTAVYSAATLVGPIQEDEGQSSSGPRPPQQRGSAFVVCLCERRRGPGPISRRRKGAVARDEAGSAPASVSEDCVTTAMVAVSPSTGEVLWDQWDDSGLRSELETRLAHVQPVELLLPPQDHDSVLLTPASMHMLRAYARGSGGGDGQQPIRTEVVPAPAWRPVQARKALQQLWPQLDTIPLMDDEAMEDDDGDGDDDVLLMGGSKPLNGESDGGDGESRRALAHGLMTQLPPLVLRCVGVLAQHLRQFSLSQLLQLWSNFERFSTQTSMRLGAAALHNLHLVTNPVTGGREGTLLHLLDHTATPGGARMLRHWVTHPLVDAKRISQRQAAVREIAATTALTHPAWSLLVQQMLGLSLDLERGICQLYYGRCTPAQFHSILSAFDGLVPQLSKLSEDAFESEALQQLLARVAASQLTPYLRECMSHIRPTAAASNDYGNLFRADDTVHQPIHAARARIADVEQRLQQHLVSLRTLLRKPSLKYVEKNQDIYLIELTKAEARKAPSDWIAQQNTTKVTRFHSPEVIDLLRELSIHKEHLLLESQNAWSEYLSRFADRYGAFRSIVRVVSELDCLRSLAIVSQLEGYCWPKYSGDMSCGIRITGGRHPVVEQGLKQGASGDQFIDNDTHLDTARCMVLTGPNMGGKSTYVRQVALICIMGQMGCPVPAASAALPVLDAVYVRMGASDRIEKGRSTFFTELSETSEILREATSQSLIILDELGRGTSTHDGTAIAYATLHHVIQRHAFCLFVTHYPILGQLEDEYPQHVRNCHMGFLECDGADTDSNVPDDSSITLLYKLEDGIVKRSFGLNVARLAFGNLDAGVLTRAHEMAAAFERASREATLMHQIRLIQSTGANRQAMVRAQQEVRGIMSDGVSAMQQ